MEIAKTVCPRCFKLFEASEEFDLVRCIRCRYEYELPKLRPKNSVRTASGETMLV